jgi:NAD(P)-dependent dehydrogenase (short-subunit alcohol dehydrogenase family)
MLGSPDSKYYSVHATPRGANDARPTALQIVHDEGLANKWPDKTVLITGGGASIGAETARALHATGATVYITVRDTTKGQAAIDSIMKSDPTNKAPIHMLTMNLDDLGSVRRGAEEFLQASKGKLNVLVCNAGVMACPFALTKDGHETQFQVNYLSHFLLFQLLKSSLLSSASDDFASRVIMLSSESHRHGPVRFHDYDFASTSDEDKYHPMKAYGQSKTACIYLANTIDRRFGSQGLHSLSLHPGAIRSGITFHVRKMAEPMWEIPSVKCREKSPAQGAATTVYAATSKEWEGRGGRFLSNCMEMGPWNGEQGVTVMDEGYAPWIYDEAQQDKLWADSMAMVGMTDSSNS